VDHDRQQADGKYFAIQCFTSLSPNQMATDRIAIVLPGQDVPTHAHKLIRPTNEHT